MSKGDFSASVASVESQQRYMTSVRFSALLDIQGESLDGLVGFGLHFDTGKVIAYGNELRDGDLIVYSPGSEIDLRTEGDVISETLYLPKATLEAACRSVAPRSRLLSDGFPSIVHCDPERFVGIRKRIQDYVAEGSLDDESASRLVAETIVMAAEAVSESSFEDLANVYAVDIARRARSYIEDHLDDTIRLEDLCSEVGVGLRTLQRCFSTRFQIGAVAYIKARRLNRARRELVSADPTHTSVTRIALDNGLAHLGRFSVDYRSYFGESPHQTLLSKVA